MRILVVLVSFSVILPHLSGQISGEDDASLSRLHRIVVDAPEDLQQLLRSTGRPLPMVSSHRGGAGPGFPENCIETFERTLAHTHSLLEIDPRLTADGEVVIHHDATLERTTTGIGRLSDHTLAQLEQLRLKDSAGQLTDFRMPTLDAVLEWGRGKAILVLDQKDVPLETRIAKIEQHHAESYAMLIISKLDDARVCYRLNPRIMMEFMVIDWKMFEAFDRSGIPWSNIVAFVGHQPPEDLDLLKAIHEKGTICMAGTSRHLDKDLDSVGEAGLPELKQRYFALVERGVDLFETDRPVEVGRFVAERSAVVDSLQPFLIPPDGQ